MGIKVQFNREKPDTCDQLRDIAKAIFFLQEEELANLQGTADKMCCVNFDRRCIPKLAAN